MFTFNLSKINILQENNTQWKININGYDRWINKNGFEHDGFCAFDDYEKALNISINLIDKRLKKINKEKILLTKTKNKNLNIGEIY